jgi:hypothetical protein
MANAAARGGNLLMNIGPMGDGRIDPRDVAILNSIGQWMNVNGESIYGTSTTPLPLQSWGTSTLKKNKLYLHVFQRPANNQLVVGGLKSNLTKAYLLADLSKKELKSKRLNNLDLVLYLPEKAPDAVNSIIVIETIDGKIETDSVRLLTGEKFVQRLLAFDASQKGEGFRYGDGKADRFYIEGWNKKDQTLRWNFRINEPMSFQAKLKYIAVAEGGGQIQMRLNGNIIFDRITINDKQSGPSVKELGVLSLKPGSYTLTISPVSIEGSELMKLLEIELIPGINNSQRVN